MPAQRLSCSREGPRMGEKGYAVTGDGVARFELGGGASDTRLEGSGARCVAVDPRAPRRVYVGTMDDGLFISEDGGDSWRATGPGLADQRVLSVAVSPSHQEAGVSVVYAGTEPSNLYRSEDGGQSWQALPAL